MVLSCLFPVPFVLSAAMAALVVPVVQAVTAQAPQEEARLVTAPLAEMLVL